MPDYWKKLDELLSEIADRKPVTLKPELYFGHGSAGPPHPREIPWYVQGAFVGPLENATQRAAEARAKAIESAVTSWAAQSNLTVPEWLKRYGYTVEQKWEDWRVTFIVRAQSAYPGQEVVMPPSRLEP